MKIEMNDRIRQRRVQLKLTQEQLAKLIKVSRVSVTKWESGIMRPDGENLHILAKVLSCSVSYLLYGIDQPSQQNNAEPLIKIPVIMYFSVDKWLKEGDPDTPLGWINASVNTSPKAFGLKIAGDSMVNLGGGPSLSDGGIVTVNPDIKAKNGQIVVARLKEYGTATVKKLVEDAPNKHLMPLNPNYRPIYDDFDVIGVCIKFEISLI